MILIFFQQNLVGHTGFEHNFHMRELSIQIQVVLDQLLSTTLSGHRAFTTFAMNNKPKNWDESAYTMLTQTTYPVLT